MRPNTATIILASRFLYATKQNAISFGRLFSFTFYDTFSIRTRNFWRVLSDIQLSWFGILVLPAVFEPYATGAGMYGLFPQDLARLPLLSLVRKPDF